MNVLIRDSIRFICTFTFIQMAFVSFASVQYCGFGEGQGPALDTVERLNAFASKVAKRRAVEGLGETNRQDTALKIVEQLFEGLNSPESVISKDYREKFVHNQLLQFSKNGEREWPEPHFTFLYKNLMVRPRLLSLLRGDILTRPRKTHSIINSYIGGMMICYSGDDEDHPVLSKLSTRINELSKLKVFRARVISNGAIERNSAAHIEALLESLLAKNYSALAYGVPDHTTDSTGMFGNVLLALNSTAFQALKSGFDGISLGSDTAGDRRQIKITELTKVTKAEYVDEAQLRLLKLTERLDALLNIKAITEALTSQDVDLLKGFDAKNESMSVEAETWKIDTMSEGSSHSSGVISIKSISELLMLDSDVTIRLSRPL